MISLRKYLDAQALGYNQQAGSNSQSTVLKLLSGVFASVNRYVLTGDSNDALRAQLVRLNDGLRPDISPEDALAAENSTTRILSDYRESSRQRELVHGTQMQHIFAMLNQALIGFAEGSDRSVSGLAKIQASLERASTIGDIVALKSSLEATLRLVKQESVQAQANADQELSRFETAMTKSREFLWSARMKLAGRPEAVEKISDSMGTLEPSEALYAVAYDFLNRMQAVTQRYGPAVAEELTFCLIRERIQPVAPVDATYRWTSSSLVTLFCQQRDLASLRAKLTNLNRTPVVHRIALGNRTAMLTIAPSHLVAEGIAGCRDELIEEVDRFTGAQA